MSVSHAVCPVIDNEFRHNIVKVILSQLLWQFYDEIHDQQHDRRMKNWRQFVS